MEILHNLYQQRIDSLAHTFLALLKQLEKTLTPFNSPELVNHRIQYLSHIITSTLQDDKERFIAQLCEQVQELRNQLSLQISAISDPNFSSKDNSRNSTCSRQSAMDHSGSQAKSPIQTFQVFSQKNSRSRNPSCLEQTYLEGDVSVCDSTVSNTLKKRGVGSRSQTSIKLQNELKSRLQYQKQQQPFQFKYLRFGRC